MTSPSPGPPVETVGAPTTNPYVLPLLRPAVGLLPRRSPKKAPSETSESVSAASSVGDRSRRLRPLRIEDLTALYTLQAPAPQFQGKVHLDTSHMDLKWLFTRPIRPPAKWLTLEDMREDLLLTPTRTAAEALEQHETVLLNSPRSVLTMLRNGVTVEAMQERSTESYLQQGSLEGLPDHVVQKRIKHRESKRRRDLAQLREEYGYYKAQMPMETVLAFFDMYDSAVPSALSTNQVYLEVLATEADLPHASSFVSAAGRSASPVPHVAPSPQPTDLPEQSLESIPSLGSPAPRPEKPPPLQSRLVRTLPALVHSASPVPKGDAKQLDTSLASSVGVGSLARSPSALSPLRSGPSNRSLTLSPSPSRSLSPGLSAVLDPAQLRKREENALRIEKHLTTDLGVRERAIEMRRAGIETSAQREILFEQRMKQRKRARQLAIAEQAAALRASTEKHQQRAQRKLEELEHHVQEASKRKADTEQARLDFVEALKEQRRTIASKNKTKRAEKLLATQLRQAQLEEERIIHFEAQQREMRLRHDEAMMEKQQEKERVRDEAFEKATQRLYAQQRAAVIALERRMEAEDRQERTAQRVDVFREEKQHQESQRKVSDELRSEKRQRVFDQAVAIVERHRDETLNKQAQFEERWKKLQEQRTYAAEAAKEELRLRVRDKVEFRDRARSALEFEKLCVIDEIQRKTDKIDRTSSSKVELLKAMKWDYEERKRDRDRVVQQMERSQIENEKAATFHIFNQPALD